MLSASFFFSSNEKSPNSLTFSYVYLTVLYAFQTMYGFCLKFWYKMIWYPRVREAKMEDTSDVLVSASEYIPDRKKYLRKNLFRKKGKIARIFSSRFSATIQNPPRVTFWHNFLFYHFFEDTSPLPIFFSIACVKIFIWQLTGVCHTLRPCFIFTKIDLGYLKRRCCKIMSWLSRYILAACRSGTL